MRDEELEVITATAKGTVEGALKPIHELAIWTLGPAASSVRNFLFEYANLWTRERTERLRERFRRAVGDRQVQPSLSPSLFILAIERAAIEEGDDLQDHWATLLANAATATRGKDSYRTFADLLRQVTPSDVAALDQAFKQWREEHSKAVAEHKTSDSLEPFVDWIRVEEFFPDGSDLTIANLKRLGIIDFEQVDEINFSRYCFTTLGVQFVEACDPAPIGEPDGQ